MRPRLVGTDADQREDARPDDRPDTERDEMRPAERPRQPVPFVRFRDDGFAAQQAVGHMAVPLF